ncbi:hypothetical protein AB0C59_31900 [Streptomyces sp. NPDC048664]|uniref:hypothetical protein n=1 Tax=Streptomyces sp. NPDC048664 TaxID=3154505 RepID=UPI00341E9871
MEQRIGSSSQPLDGAGVDPAFIPGLISPVSAAEPEGAEPGGTGPEPAEPETAEADGVAQAAEPDAVKEPERTDADQEEPARAADEPGVDEPGVDGPVFEASDRRARIVADAAGVRLSLDDQECEFRWDEIGAVETETARFGKRFTVTVHTPDRRWYPIEIDADSRSRFADWEAGLDQVLDAYFEDSDGGEDAGAGEPEDAGTRETASAATGQDD